MSLLDMQHSAQPRKSFWPKAHWNDCLRANSCKHTPMQGHQAVTLTTSAHGPKAIFKNRSGKRPDMRTIGDTIPSMPLVFPCVVAIVLELPWNRLGIFLHLPCKCVRTKGEKEGRRSCQTAIQRIFRLLLSQRHRAKPHKTHVQITWALRFNWPQ